MGVLSKQPNGANHHAYSLQKALSNSIFIPTASIIASPAGWGEYCYWGRFFVDSIVLGQTICDVNKRQLFIKRDYRRVFYNFCWHVDTTEIETNSLQSDA